MTAQRTPATDEAAAEAQGQDAAADAVAVLAPEHLDVLLAAYRILVRIAREEKAHGATAIDNRASR